MRSRGRPDHENDCEAIATSAAAAIGAAAVGVTSVASGAPSVQWPSPSARRCRRTRFRTANVPTADQLTGVLNSLADPNVPFANKSNLVEGGISGTEAHLADHEFKKAAKNGDLPLAFNVANIQPGPPRVRPRLTLPSRAPRSRVRSRRTSRSSTRAAGCCRAPRRWSCCKPRGTEAFRFPGSCPSSSCKVTVPRHKHQPQREHWHRLATGKRV